MARSSSPGLYVLPDGAYFEGELVDNRAHCDHGRYVNRLLTYEGGFRDNLFSGRGVSDRKGNVLTLIDPQSLPN
jgi:hypothetical protein